MTIILFYLLFISYELYYVSSHFGGARAFLLVKVATLFLCASYGILKIRDSLSGFGPFDAILILFYVLMIFASSIFSISPLYVCIYGFMFLALQIFAMHVGSYIVVERYYIQFKYLNLIFTILIALSLAGYIFSFTQFFYRDVWGNLRVNGVFGEPSRLAQISALNILLSIFYLKNFSVRAGILIISLFALLLAGNRSYMFAILFIVYALALRKVKINAFMKIAVSVLVFSIPVALFINPGIFGEHVRHYLRLESIDTLSGRTHMWMKAISVALEKPLGEGFCLGGMTLVEASGKRTLFNFRSQHFNMFKKTLGAKRTLHNGYLQVLCDLGIIGAALYVLIFFRGLFFAYKNLSSKDMGPFICILVFFAIVNFSATILVGPAENNTLLFWVCWYTLMFSYRRQKPIAPR